MTCRDFADFLMEYITGSLSTAERTVFEEHLSECPDCVAYLSTYGQTINLGKAAYKDEDQGHEDVPEDLVQAILAARARAPGAT